MDSIEHKYEKKRIEDIEGEYRCYRDCHFSTSRVRTTYWMVVQSVSKMGVRRGGIEDVYERTLPALRLCRQISHSKFQLRPAGYLDASHSCGARIGLKDDGSPKGVI